MNILIWIITGLIAAYLAGLIIKGCGLGLLRNIDVGLIGGLLRGWFFNLVGVSVPGWPGQVLVAAVYAFMEEIDQPCVIKPLTGSGSQSSEPCDS